MNTIRIHSSSAPYTRTPHTFRRASILHIFLGAIVFFILVLILLVAFAPKIASIIAPRYIERSIAAASGYNATVENLSLSWRGPQRLGRLHLTDHDDITIADISLEHARTLASYTGDLTDLGALTLRGLLVIPERAAADPQAHQPPARSPSDPRTDDPAFPRIKIAPNLAAKLAIESLRIGVHERSADGAVTVREVVTLDGAAALLGNGRAQLTLDAAGLGALASDAFALSLDADHLTDTSGFVRPEQAAASLKAEGSISQSLLDALSGLGARAGDDSVFSASLHLALADGRLTLADPANTPQLSGRLPAALVDLLHRAAPDLTLTNAPHLDLFIESLDVDLAPVLAGRTIPLSSATARINLRASPAHLTLTNDLLDKPRRIRIDGADIALIAGAASSNTSLTADARMTIDDTDAGTLELRLSTGKLPDDPAADPLALPLSGTIKLLGVSTAIAQPFVESRGIDLIAGLGPTFDARAAISSPGSHNGSAANQFLIEFDLKGTSPTSIAGAFTASPGRFVRAERNGVFFSTFAARTLIPPDLLEGFEMLEGDGAIVLAAPEFDLPLRADNTPDLARASARLRAAVGELRWNPGPDHPPVLIRSADIECIVKPDVPPIVALDARFTSNEQPFTATGQLHLHGLDAADLAEGRTPNPALITPIGSITLSALPANLLRIASPHADLLNESIGDTITLNIFATQGAVPGPHLAFDLSSGNANASMNARLDNNDLLLEHTVANLSLTPGLIDSAITTLSPELSPRPALGAPIEVQLITGFPIRIPTTNGWLPDTGRVGPINVQLRTNDDVIVRNLPPIGENPPLDAGARNLLLRLNWDPASKLRSSFLIIADVFDPAAPNALLGKLRAETALTGGPDAIEATLTECDTRRIERWLRRPDALEPILGATLGLWFKMDLDQQHNEHGATIQINADRLAGTAHLRTNWEEFWNTEPAIFRWTLDPRLANATLSKTPADSGDPPLTLAAPADVLITLLDFAGGPPSAPLKPGIFRLDLRLTTPELRLTAGGTQTIHIADAKAHLRSTTQHGALEFAVEAPPHPDAATRGLDIAGRITNLADDTGALTPDRAAITATATGQLATPIIDAIARWNGMATEVIGPIADIDLRAVNFSHHSGALTANLSTDYAAAHIAGEAHDGVFIASESATASLRRLSPQSSARLFNTMLPVLHGFQKTERDEPALITAEGLQLPLDGDLRKLNGDITIDLGTVRFEAAPFLAALLKATHNKPLGTLGEKVEPFTLNITNGIIRYDTIVIPTGDFRLETSGRVNLNNRKIDATVFIPFYAINDRFTRTISQVPGLSELTMVPIRVKGTLDKPEAQLDPAALLRRAPDNIGNTIDNILGGILSGGRDRNDDNKEKDKK